MLNPSRKCKVTKLHDVFCVSMINQLLSIKSLQGETTKDKSQQQTIRRMTQQYLSQLFSFFNLQTILNIFSCYWALNQTL